MKKFDSMGGNEIPIEPEPSKTVYEVKFDDLAIDGSPISMGDRIVIRAHSIPPSSGNGIYTRNPDPREHRPVIDPTPTVQGHLDRIDRDQLWDPEQTDFTFHMRAATNSHNVTLFGRQIVDAVRLQHGDWVLVKDQADADENGVYVVEEGHWSRLAGFSTPIGSLGTLITVDEGYSNARSTWLIGAHTPDMSEFSSLIFIRGRST